MLIIAREYLSRVRKKSFIIMTLLGPLLFGGFFYVIKWAATKGTDTKAILVLDESGQFMTAFSDTNSATYDYMVDENLEVVKEHVRNGSYNGLLHIPKLDIDAPQGVTYYSISNPSFLFTREIEKELEKKIEKIKLERSGISQEVLDALKANVHIATINLGEAKEKKSSSAGATAIGYMASFMIYLFIFLYGTMCMRGVVEEKTSRIIEVVIASVKPFHLMMGKIVGIAAVGLTQFVLWIVLTLTVGTLAGSNLSGTAREQMPLASGLEVVDDRAQAKQPKGDVIAKVSEAVETVNLPLTLVCFLFFFLTGYLLYGALFAAIGSAVDSDADAQQFMFPVTMPLVAAIVMLSAVINDPNGSLATWLSLIPLTSPVVMMMRVPFGVPGWQLILSMVLMVLGFAGATWVASRIYRIGILMHGTKVNYRVLAKWLASNQ